MREPVWELVVRRCGNRLVVKLDDETTLFNQHHDTKSEVKQRLPLNEKLKAAPHQNVLTFEGYNEPSDPWETFNPWVFQVDILRDGEVKKTLAAHGASQRNRTESKVWSEQVWIKLPDSRN